MPVHCATKGSQRLTSVFECTVSDFRRLTATLVPCITPDHTSPKVPLHADAESVRDAGLKAYASRIMLSAVLKALSYITATYVTRKSHTC